MRFNPNPDGGNIDRGDVDYPYKDMLEHHKKSTYAWQPGDTDKVLRVTKSALGTFDWCPQQYFLQKVLKLPQGPATPDQTRGSNVHDAVEYWWNAMHDVVHDVYELFENGDVEKALSLSIDALPQPPEPYIFGEVEQLHLYVLWQFQRLCNTDKDDIHNWFPIGNEALVHGIRTVTASDGTEVEIHMNGFIDRIFLDDDKMGIVLMELKTGKFSKNKPSQMRAEMQFYRMLLEHSPHEEFLPVVAWGWQFPGGDRNGGTGPEWDYESVSGPGGRYAPRTVEKRLKRLVDAHLAQDFPPIKIDNWSDWKCSYCDYMEFCPAWGGEVKIDEEE
jgi:RecB family exonuclease